MDARRHIDAIFEHPHLIGKIEYDLEQVDKNKATLERLIKEPDLEEIGSFKGIPLYRNGHEIFSTQEGMIICMVVYEVRQIPRAHITGICQVKLWRGFGPRGMTAYIFWELLMPILGVMVSDSLHSDDGKKFWQDSVSEALLGKGYVYLVNRVTGRIQAIKSQQEYADSWVTGYAKHDGMNWRYVITLAPLKESPGSVADIKPPFPFEVH
jgi:hypothetical protein